MNRGRGIRPKTIKKEDIQTQSLGEQGGLNMGAMFWFQTLAAVINSLKLPEKDKLEEFIQDIHDKKIGQENLQEILEFALNHSIALLINGKAIATANESIGDFFKKHYSGMVGEKVIIKSDFHDLWAIEFKSLEDPDPIKIYSVEKKKQKSCQVF